MREKLIKIDRRTVKESCLYNAICHLFSPGGMGGRGITSGDGGGTVKSLLSTQPGSPRIMKMMFCGIGKTQLSLK